MTSWTDPTRPRGLRGQVERPPGVVLRPEAQERHTSLDARLPDPALSPWVERHWMVSWDLEETRRLPAALVPALAHNLTHEVGGGRPEVGEDAVVVTGVPTRRFDVDLRGRGFVVGTKFRPGAFAAITGVPASALTDRTVQADEIVASPVVGAYARVRSLDDMPAEAEPALAELTARVDPAWLVAHELVVDLGSDDSLTSVAQLVRRSGLGERSLQRLFARFIGVSPKQAIVRARLHDVVAALDSGSEEPLVDLAGRLGFFDQSHLSREFARFVGIPPAAYRAGGSPRN